MSVIFHSLRDETLNSERFISEKAMKINSYTIFVNCDKKKLKTNRRVI